MAYIQQFVEDVAGAKCSVEEAMRERGHTPNESVLGGPAWRSVGHLDGSVIYSLDCTMCHQWGSVASPALTMIVPDKCKLHGRGG